MSASRMTGRGVELHHQSGVRFYGGDDQDRRRAAGLGGSVLRLQPDSGLLEGAVEGYIAGFEIEAPAHQLHEAASHHGLNLSKGLEHLVRLLPDLEVSGELDGHHRIAPPAEPDVVAQRELPVESPGREKALHFFRLSDDFRPEALLQDPEVFGRQLDGFGGGLEVLGLEVIIGVLQPGRDGEAGVLDVAAQVHVSGRAGTRSWSSASAAKSWASPRYPA